MFLLTHLATVAALIYRTETITTDVADCKLELNVLDLFPTSGEKQVDGNAALLVTKMAIEHINNRTDILPRPTLTFFLRDSQDKKVHGSRSVLALWSPVMKAMFLHDFKEEGSVEIPLPEKKYEDIVELMEVLHPPNKDIGDNNVAVLLPLAREYQINKLTKRCEDFLLSKTASLASLVLADEYSLKKLREKCMEYTKSRRFDQLTSEIGWDDMSKDTKITILYEKVGKYEAQLDKNQP